MVNRVLRVAVWQCGVYVLLTNAQVARMGRERDLDEMYSGTCYEMQCLSLRDDAHRNYPALECVCVYVMT